MFLKLLYKKKDPGKLLCRLLFFLSLLVCYSSYAQQVSLRLKNAALPEVFTEIKKQTGTNFVFTSEVISKTNPVSISVKNEDLKKVLSLVFKNQPVIYSLEENYVIIKLKPEEIRKDLQEFKGRILDEYGRGLGNASISTEGSNVVTTTDENGYFILRTIGENVKVLISCIGYQTIQALLIHDSISLFQLQIQDHRLDDTVIIAYGVTTKRLNTGSVGRISGEVVSMQPVPNVLTALHGRIPGLSITQTSGLPGAAVKVLIRGRTSINTAISNEPLFIIDGVPFAPNNESINQLPSALGQTGLSPFSMINPGDIESIEVLKDADATAIYGSRGANGVILITTKKGKSGKATVHLDYYSGWSKVTRTMDMLNTTQYLEMRREAFKNDTLSPNATAGSPGYAPDLMIWDTTRYTDLKKLLLGGTAKTLKGQVSLSGGNQQTKFLIGSAYHRETTIFPGNMNYQRGSFHFNLDHHSSNNQFGVSLRANYSGDDNHIGITDLTSFINLPPNIPKLKDESGNLIWQQGGVSFNNPYAFLLRTYRAQTDNLLANLQLSYEIVPRLVLKTNLGFNSVNVSEKSRIPIASQNPLTNPQGSANFGTGSYKTVIAEPQLEYRINTKQAKIQLLVGSTWQESKSEKTSLNGTGYTSDAMLQSISGAAATSFLMNSSIYRYAAVFGRFNLNLREKYLLNLTGRRDGSSRFGPGNQYSNFGAAGIGWVFSKEPFFKRSKVSFFGKLRGSFGITGNDKIGNYGYLDTYSNSIFPYQSVPGIFPTELFNPDFVWELNKKLEVALETSFFHERLMFTIACYNNRSSNQLITYELPLITGDNNIIVNFPATVENAGWEMEVSTVNFQKNKFKWSTDINLTIPRNRLVRFPGIETSSYASRLQVGEPLSIFGGYKFMGVNPSSGVFQFQDKNGNATSAPITADRFLNLGNLEPKYYGGISNDFTFKDWELSIFFEGKRQKGKNYISNIYTGTTYPGTMFNQPVVVLNRWQKAGDETDIQRFTTRTGSPAYSAANLLRLTGSDNKYSDASYIRLKNINLSWQFPLRLQEKLHFNARVFLQGQNLLVITRYKGTDPETQELSRLPPMRTLATGIRLTF